MNVSYASDRLADQSLVLRELVVGSMLVGLLLVSAVWAFRSQLALLVV